MSGKEYFDGIALGNEPREGSGSMTIHSFSVNYDGGPAQAFTSAATNSAATTGTGQGSYDRASLTYDTAIHDGASLASDPAHVYDHMWR